MKITRSVRPDQNFTIVANAALRDKRLSFKARGLLAFLLSLPDQFSMSSERLAEEGKDGRDSVRAGLAELEAAGYLTRTRVQNERGLWSTEGVIHDQPMTGFPASDNPPMTDYPASVNPAPENPAIKEEDFKNKKTKTKPGKPGRVSGVESTLSTWLASLGDEMAIGSDDPIYAWADRTGIPDLWINAAWFEFKARFADPDCTKVQKDWRGTFRTYVRNDYLKIWRADRDGKFVLTTAGETTLRSMRAEVA